MATAATLRSLWPLFASHHELRAVVDAVLEGRHGRAVGFGGAGRLSVGCYEIFGGDAASPAARRLVAEAARPRELLYGNDPAWRRLILDVHGEQVFDRPMRDFDPSGLDRAALLRLEASCPPASPCAAWTPRWPSSSAPTSSRTGSRCSRVRPTSSRTAWVSAS